ncbi:MAG: DMT family transporter [Thermoleophilia bacterium]
MAAILLACLAGAGFGALAVASRWGLTRGGDPETGGLASASIGAVVAVIAAAVSGIGPDDLRWDELWPFLVLGLAVPGVAQIIFVRAVRAIGPSRSAILIGTVPFLSVLLAIGLLDERPNVWLWIGTVLIVVGGALLAWEPTRPEGFRAIGILFAFTCAIMFGFRDVAVRWAAEGRDPPPLAAAAATLLAATVGSAAYLLLFRRGDLGARLRRAYPAFLPSGLMLGVAYCSLLEAFERGRVAIVAPLNATQSLWALVFAWAVLGRRSEAIGLQLAAASLLVVAGSAIIGVFR